MFSRRTGWPRHANRLSELIAAAPGPLVDLTESNPTRAGLGDATLVELLGDPRGAAYRPDARGELAAREAVSRYYAARGATVAPEAIVLSASTSEAYGWLFKLLCDPGDTALVPAPADPLLPFLAELEEVVLAPYPLVREEHWRIDLARTERALAETKARALVLVHPGNPTGAFTHRGEAHAISALARAAGAALIVDEVFADYAHGALPGDRLPTFAGGGEALTFVLSGLSKIALAPQLKLGWIAVAGGTDEQRREAIARLEVIADSYLSVGTPVQLALPEILRRAPELQARVLARLEKNLAALDAALAARGGDCPLRRLPLDGGWYALIDVPRTGSDDDWLAATLAAGVIVHPGYFFDIHEPGTMVVSLLGEEATFADGIARAIAVWDG